MVSPIDEQRQKVWEKIYGRTELPVKYAQPHTACTQRWGEVAVYYLDPTAVPDALLDRLAAFEARRLGISYAEARNRVRYEWLIPAEGCALAAQPHHISATHTQQMAFEFLQQIPVAARHPLPRHPRITPAYGRPAAHSFATG
jgi:hypothetical protein